MPRVARLSISPVRSLGLQHPRAVDLTPAGVVEDRRFYLVDETGRFIDRTVIGRLVQVAAETDAVASRLRLTFPDGEVVEDDVWLGDAVTTEVYDRTAEGQYVEGPWSDALSAFAGRRLRLVRTVRPGGTRRSNAVSLVGDGSLAALARQAGVAAVDGRRFRMLIEIEGLGPHEEDGWIGGRVAIGETVLEITKPTARCAITTQDPDTGARDLDTLRAIIGYRGLREGKKADFGVLGEVVQPGRVRVGDRVEAVPIDARAREDRASRA